MPNRLIGPRLPNHDLDDIIREALEDVIVLARRRSIDLGVTARATAPVFCDRHELRMLVGNLLDNAVRYTPEGGRVDVAVDINDGLAILRINDNGPGIPEGDLSQLFDRFARFGTADTQGSGLGLAIVKAIATRHAARIEVHNRPECRGLSVAIIFPLA